MVESISYRFRQRYGYRFQNSGNRASGRRRRQSETLVLSGLADQNFRLQMNDVETPEHWKNATGDIILSGSDTSGLQKPSR